MNAADPHVVTNAHFSFVTRPAAFDAPVVYLFGISGRE
jgi:hypothetical protein